MTHLPALQVLDLAHVTVTSSRAHMGVDPAAFMFMVGARVVGPPSL